HTRFSRDWSSDVCSSDLDPRMGAQDFISLLMGSLTKEIEIEIRQNRRKAVRIFQLYSLIAKLRLQPVWPVRCPRPALEQSRLMRSEERRVGKGWRSGGCA